MALNLPGVESGANTKWIKSLTYKVNKAGKEVLERHMVESYLEQNEDKLDPKCVRDLDRQRFAVLVDVAFIEDGTVTFKKISEADAKVDASEAASRLGVSVANASSNWKKNADGEMTIKQRLYVGFKEAFYVSGNLAGRLPEAATEDLKKAAEKY